MAENKLKVLFAASEVSPYVKTGGLGDVAGSLPKELVRLGVDARVIVPKYGCIEKKHLSKSKHINSFELFLGWRKHNASLIIADPKAETPVYMIENSRFFDRDGVYGYSDEFERFAFFTKAAVESLAFIGFKPDIIHFNDWQTGLGSVYLNDSYKKFTFYSGIKTLFTVHNLQYQGVFGREVLDCVDLNDGYFSSDKLEFYGNINFMKAGIKYSDAVNTVSEQYSREIQTPDYGFGMDGIIRERGGRLSGILNGIDCDVFNPATDGLIYENYSAGSISGKAANKTALQRELGMAVRADVPILGIVSRIVDQKGFDLLADIADDLLARDIQLVILGAGDGRYENIFREIAGRNPDRVSANILFSEELAHRIYAAGDMFLMPSRFEPCGLSQLIAMRYGSVPVVRKTGGLSDSVVHFDAETGTGTGFVFRDYLAGGLLWGIDEALSVYRKPEKWNRLVANAMNADFSWEKSAKQYIELYKRMLKYS